MNAPPVQQLGAAVVLQGAALANVRRCVRLAQRVSARDGIRLGHWFDDLTCALDAAMSDLGHADVDTRPSVPQSLSTDKRIGTKEAAAMIGLSERQVRRIAASLDGNQLPSGAWHFDADAVAAYALAKEAHRG